MKPAPWFLPPPEAARFYAKALEQIRKLEALAKRAGRRLRP